MAISELQLLQRESSRIRSGGTAQSPTQLLQTNLQKNASTKNEQTQKDTSFWGGVGYTLEKLGLGVLRGLEGVTDFVVGGVADLFGGDEFAENVMKSDWVNYGHADEWYDAGETMSFVGDVASGIGNMLPAIAVNFIPGVGQAASAAISTATFATSAAGQATSDAVKETGELGGKEWLYGTASGALEAGIERISGGIGGTAAGKGLAKAFGKTTLGKVAGNFIGEGVEEVASDLLDPALRKVTGMSDTYEAPSVQELGRTFLVGGATGAVMGGGTRLLKAAKAGGFNNLNAAEAMQELTERQADNNLRQIKGKSAIYTEQDIARTKENLSKRLRKMDDTTRAQFLKANSNIANQFNEDGTVKDFAPAPETYNEGTYSASLKGRESTLAYKPVAETSAESAVAKKVMKTLTKMTDGNTNIVLTDELLTTEDGQKANGLYKDGVIYLDAKATDYDKALTVGVHEVIHGLEGTKEYNDLASYIAETISKDPELAKKYSVEKYRAVYDKILEGEWTEATKDYQASTEIFADYLANKVVTNEKMLNNLVMRNSNVVVRFVNWVRNSIAKLGDDADEKLMRKGLKKLEKALEKALEAGTGGISLERVEELSKSAEKRLKTQDGNVQSVKFEENKKADGKLATARASIQTIDGEEISENAKKVEKTSTSRKSIDVDEKTLKEKRTMGSARFSLAKASEIAENQTAFNEKMKFVVDENVLKKGIESTARMVKLLSEHKDILPEDRIGKVLKSNSSYDKSVENTTICVRTLAYNEFIDMVSEEVGRPLTQAESFLVSQKLYEIAVDPQCLYCYVSLDRKAYNEFLIRYINERDEVIEAYKKSNKSKQAVEDLYEKYRNKRKDTANMRTRFDMFIEMAKKGITPLTAKEVSTKARQSEIASRNDYTSVQWKDMAAYAQSASWAKKQFDYVAYYNDILTLSQQAVNNLNKHYGLRFYSFSDYTAAFIVENMQQVTDAAIRGLKGLGYTKDTDFARIFAPTGMNINISMYAYKNRETGEWDVDPRQSANLDEAIALREKYPNVGIVVTATTDEGVEWALKQKWSDVVIPFHIVRTGADVAEFYKWQNYTTESADTIADENLWEAYVNGRKKVSKNIYPAEHQNDRDTYFKLIKERGLKPRFERFKDNPNYMKLVNETRQSAQDTKPMQPIFDEKAAVESFNKFAGKGGYFKGWYKEGVDVKTEVKAVAKDVQAGKKANEVEYGRQDVDFDKVASSRKANRTHSRASIEVDAALADFPSIDKWFESLTVEELRELIDNDYSVKDISEELNVEPQKLRYLIKREGLGNSYVEDSKKAVMKQTRIDEAIEDSGASNPTYARDYITAISPKDFIDLTVTKNHVERDAFDAEVIGDHGSKMGEYDYEKALQTSRSPYLQIDKATGRVIGHNGRHRIRALEKAGIQSVEIQVEFFDEDGRLIKYNAETIPKMAISSQFDTDIETTISKIIPLNEAHRAEIENTYGERANTNAGVRYSLNVAETYTPKQAAKAIDDVVDMLVEIGGVDVDQYDVQVYGKDALAKRIAEQLNAKATTSTKTAVQRAEGFIDEILDKVRIAKTDVAALIDAEQTLNFLRKYYHSMDLRSVKSDINNERHYNLFSGGEKAMAWDSVLQEIVELHPDFEMDTDIETLLNVMDAYENARNTIRENKVPLSKIVLDLGFAKQMMKEQLKNSLEGNATTYKKVKKQSFAKELEVKKGSGTIDAELDKKTTERVQTVVSDEKLTLKERWENTVEKLKEGRLDQWMKAQIAWTDEQAGILGAGKNVGVVLHGDVQRARSAKAAAMNMLNNEQRDFSGKKRVGDSLKSIFQPIQSRGEKVSKAFNLYLLHQLNADRMSNVETADRRIKALFKANPMLEDAVNGQYEDAEQWRRAVQKESGGKEYLELLDVENKPVFEEKVDKAFSLEKIQQLEKQYPEFKEAAKKVWNYNKNLLQYRVEAGLITQAQADQMSDMYPHYVPAFYEKNGGSGTSGASVGNKGIAVRTGIKKAKGSTGVSDIKDVPTSIAKQTVAVVRAASINNVVSKLYDGAVAKNDFTDIEEVGREKVANPDVDYDKEIPKVNQVYFYKDGERITLDVTDYVYAGFQGLTAQAQLSDPLTSVSAKLISLFKKSVTSWNPLFAATNAIRDAQEALFYTKYGAFKLMGNYGKSLFMRKHDPKLKELWQQYVAMGGTGSGYFSNDTGVYDARNKVKKGLAAAMEKFTWLNEWIEQTPRFAEFVASVEAGNSVEQALYDSAEVTTNFSRGGTVAKKLNRTLIPFLNPSIQGWSKLWRSWVAPMDGKSTAEIEKLSKQSKGRQILSKWGTTIFKAVAVGISVGLFNDMLYRWIDEDEDYANLPLNIKENYYLLKVGGKFIKIPKGRVVALYGSVATRISEAANGNEEALDAWNWGKSASEMVSPLESASRTIFAPFYDVATNTTWYGGQIESASMENLAPGERYDEGTSSIAIAIGKAINYSPKKIHYLIDQYSGVIGDLILPATTNKAEKDMLSSRFMVDPVYNNDISTKYYNYKDELTYAKNSGDVNAKLMLKYMNEAQDDLTEMYQKKRDIANDKSLSDKEKAAQTSAIQSLINGTLSSSIDAADEFEQLIINSGFEQAVALLEGSSEYQRMEQNVRSSAYNRMVDYYYEVCLSALTNKKLDTKYVLYGALNAPDLMIYLTDINNIESDKDKKGNTIQGSRKEKVQKYIQGLKITVQQKYILSYLAGYAPTNNGKSAISKYLKQNGYTQKEVNDLWKD